LKPGSKIRDERFYTPGKTSLTASRCLTSPGGVWGKEWGQTRMALS
jgi:hypothetical protein